MQEESVRSSRDAAPQHRATTAPLTSPLSHLSTDAAHHTTDLLRLSHQYPTKYQRRRPLVRDGKSAGEVGIGMDSRPEVRQAHATRAPLLAPALLDHIAANRQQPLGLLEASLRIAETARIAVVHEDRGRAEIGRIDHAADVSRITHGEERERLDH